MSLNTLFQVPNEWLEEAARLGSSKIIVLQDDFDSKRYPHFILRGEKEARIIEKYGPKYKGVINVWEFTVDQELKEAAEQQIRAIAIAGLLRVPDPWIYVSPNE